MATALAALPAVSAGAADKSTSAAPEIPASKSAAKPALKRPPGRPVPVHGKVIAVDLIAKTITLEKGKLQTVYRVTAETRFYAGEKPVIMAAVVIGESVEGRASAMADRKYDLNALYLKAKPREAAPAKPVDKKSGVKAPSPSKPTDSVPALPVTTAAPPKP